jgi:transposase-like protein
MKSSRYTEEQVIGILKQHQSGLGAKELCRKYGISDATFYKWRSKSCLAFYKWVMERRAYAGGVV